MKSSSLPLDPSDSDGHINIDSNNNDIDIDININSASKGHNSSGCNSDSNNKTEEDLVSKTLSAAERKTASALTVATAATAKLRCNFKNATFADIALDEEGNPIGAWSWQWHKMPLKSGSGRTAKTFDAGGPQRGRKDQLIKAVINAHNV